MRPRDCCGRQSRGRTRSAVTGSMLPASAIYSPSATLPEQASPLPSPSGALSHPCPAESLAGARQFSRSSPRPPHPNPLPGRPLPSPSPWMDAPLSGDPSRPAAPPFPSPEPHVHPSPKPLSAACLAASATTLVDGRGYHPEMRLLMLSIWVGRPSRTVAGVAGAPRRGDPLPRLVAPPSGKKKKARRAPPSVDPVSGPRLSASAR